MLSKKEYLETYGLSLVLESMYVLEIDYSRIGKACLIGVISEDTMCELMALNDEALIDLIYES